MTAPTERPIIPNMAKTPKTIPAINPPDMPVDKKYTKCSQTCIRTPMALVFCV